jgi:predicted dehydrogenase
VRPSLRSKVKQRYGFTRSYATHRELLADKDLDAVVVVTPRHLTGPTVMDCLNSGKHVLSEKPMAGTSEQGLSLLAAADDAKVRYCVGYMKRYDAGVLRARELLKQFIASGELGQILQVRATCYMGDSYCHAAGHVITEEVADISVEGWGEAPDWIPIKEQPLFARYANVYSHVTNLLNFLFLEIPTVEYFNYKQPRAHTCVLAYRDFLATLETGEIAQKKWNESIEVFFERGRLVLTVPPALLRNVPAALNIYKTGETDEMLTVTSDWSWSFRSQAEGFIKDLNMNQPSPIDAIHALEALKLIESIWSKR